jgi:hypothetical protein
VPNVAKVELSDNDGPAYAMAALRADQSLPLRLAPAVTPARPDGAPLSRDQDDRSP